MDFLLSPERHQSMLHSSYDKIGLNLKFKRVFVSVLENILGPSAVTHYNRNSAHVIIVIHRGVRIAHGFGLVIVVFSS